MFGGFLRFHFLLYQTFENLLTVTICDFIITEKLVKKNVIRFCYAKSTYYCK